MAAYCKKCGQEEIDYKNLASGISGCCGIDLTEDEEETAAMMGMDSELD